MASIIQAPAPLDLQGVQGDPFVIELNLTLVDSDLNPIDWSAVTGIPAEVAGIPSYFDKVIPIDAATPTVNNNGGGSGTGQILVSWTADQTAAFSGYESTSWALSLTLGGDGSFAVLAGSISFTPPTTPGASSSVFAELGVQVDGVTVNLAVTLGGSSGGGGGGNDLPIADIGGGVTTDSTTYDNTFTGSGKMDVAIAADESNPYFAAALANDDFPRVVLSGTGNLLFGDGSFDLNEKNADLGFATNGDGAAGIFMSGSGGALVAGNSDVNAGPNGATNISYGPFGIVANGAGNFVAFCWADPNTLEGGDSVGGNTGDVLIETDNGGIILWLCTTSGIQGSAIWTRMQAADNQGNFYVGDGQNAVSGVYNFVGGEAQNVTGNNNVVGGFENTVSGIMNGAFGTKNNVGEALFCFVAGYGNTIGGDSDSTGVFGDNNSAYADFAFITGGGALAYTAGQKVHSSTNISVIGDAQDSLVTWGVQTIDGTQAAETLLIFSSNGTEMWDRTVGFTITAVARRIDEPGTDSFWECKGVVRGNGADSYSFIGTPTFTVVAQDPGASDWVPGLALSGNILDVQITGEDGASIYWNFVARLNEVAG